MQPRSVANEETQSNRVSDFRDFVCSLFPKAILFDFYSRYWDYLLDIYDVYFEQVVDKIYPEKTWAK